MYQQTHTKMLKKATGIKTWVSKSYSLLESLACLVY